MKKLGLSIPLPPEPAGRPGGPVMDGAFVAREAERLGFESVWIAEHVVIPVDHRKSYSPAFVDKPIPPTFQDPFVALARASMATRSIKLGTSMLQIAHHHPLRLAKSVASLDLFSGGRGILGISTGWLQEEAEIMGVDFEHRWTQAREAVMALKELWTKDPAEFHGRYFSFPPVRSFPRPAQRPHPPIHLGTVAPNGLKRVVAYGDGWAPLWITPEALPERLKELDELCREAGRDRRSIEVSVMNKPADPELVGGFLRAGADRVVVGCPQEAGEREWLARVERIAKVLLPLAAKC